MEDKSMTKNHGGGIIGGAIIGGAIIEKRSLRGNHWKETHTEEIIEERGIWGASGRHLGGIWEASGSHLGLQEAMGLQEALSDKNRCPSQLNTKVPLKC